MARMKADLKLEVTIEFEDDGARDLRDQATEALMFELGLTFGKTGDAYVDGLEIVGKVEEVETSGV